MKMPYALAVAAVGIAAVASFARPPAPVPPRIQAADAALRRTTGAPAHRAAAPVVVYVAGEVKRPGVYSLEPGARVERALRAASGTTSNADLLAVNLAEPLTDGEQVLVPAKGDARYVAPIPLTRSAGRSGTRTHRRSERTHKAPPAQPVDINAADATQLESLPGIGASLAGRIVAFRELNGPFRSADELLDVAGMTDRRLDALSAYIVVR